MSDSSGASTPPNNLSKFLKDTNKLLVQMSQDIAKVNKRIGDIEGKLNKEATSSTPSHRSRYTRKDVPTEVRVST